MKIYISSDIEGTCGICSWEETESGSAAADYFRKQMSREAAACAQGALDAGAEEVFVRDAHSSAKNIDPSMLPRRTRLLRGWPGDPFCMMSGLDQTFDAAAFTGYHAWASCSGNPLSHTMTPEMESVKINGAYASEFMINAYIAGYVGVPVVFLSGDRALCDSAAEICPGISTVAVNEGIGNASVSIHPDEAAERIRSAVREALRGDYKNDCRVRMPEHFEAELNYKNHFTAYKYSFYPGAVLEGGRTVRFQSNDYGEILRFFHFCL